MFLELCSLVLETCPDLICEVWQLSLIRESLSITYATEVKIGGLPSFLPGVAVACCSASRASQSNAAVLRHSVVFEVVIGLNLTARFNLAVSLVG